MKYKYPRTYHLPFSKGYTSDDKVLESDSQFSGMKIVVTEKMDGENTTIYRNTYHARSIDSQHKDYHSWLLSHIRRFQYLISDEYRVCGEYLYAKHSIRYESLPSYFMAFSVWENEECLSWDKTKMFCKDMGIEMVPILYEGIYNTEKVISIAEKVIKNGGEGIVVRNMDTFKYEDFHCNVAKYVRENHVQTERHWSLGKIEKNMLKNQ